MVQAGQGTWSDNWGAVCRPQRGFWPGEPMQIRGALSRPQRGFWPSEPMQIRGALSWG
jgi:hypothetical protein